MIKYNNVVITQNLFTHKYNLEISRNMELKSDSEVAQILSCRKFELFCVNTSLLPPGIIILLEVYNFQVGCVSIVHLQKYFRSVYFT
jgi:hypothetical protein